MDAPYMKDWLWLVKTNKGDFFITVIGGTQEEAAKKLRLGFDVLKLNITAMIPRKRATGLMEAMGTIYDEQEEPKNELGFTLLGGKKLWEACGRGVQYQAEMIRLKKEGDHE